MRKSFFITAATTAVTIATLIANQVSATGTHNGKEYWTLDEITTFAQSAQPELDALCGGQYDMMCEMFSPELHEWTEQTEKHRAFWLFRAYDFIVSAINPTKQTLKVFYNPAILDSQLKDLLIVWFENEVDYNYAQSIASGIATANTHILFNQSTDTSDWLSAGEELELPMEDILIPAQNLDYKIFYRYTTTKSGTFSGIINYSDCINSPDYHEGMECQVMFNRERIFYLPVELPTEAPIETSTETLAEISLGTLEETPVTSPTETTIEISDPDPTETPTTEPVPDTPTEATTETLISQSPTTAEIPASPALSTLAVSIPTPTTTKTDPVENTTPIPTEEIPVPTANGEARRVKDTPIWIISLVIFICSGIILWFFLPGKRQKFSKNPKK